MRSRALSRLSISAILLLAGCVAHLAAQNNSLTLYGAGNYNPTTLLILTAQHDNPMVSFNKSSFGGAAEYDRWLTPRIAAGVLYEQNPSDIKFFMSNGKFSIDPRLTHFEVMTLVTEREPLGRLTVFQQEGTGADITYGPQPGASADIALAFGGGVEFPLARHVAIPVGILFFDSQPGCYRDPTCRPTWGVTEDGHLGIRVSW